MNTQREAKFSNFRSTGTTDGFRQREQHTEELFYPLQDAYSVKDKDESQPSHGAEHRLNMTKMKNIITVTTLNLLNRTILTSSNAEQYDDILYTVRQYKFVYHIVYMAPFNSSGCIKLVQVMLQITKQDCFMAILDFFLHQCEKVP